MNIQKAIEILTLSKKGVNLVSHEDLMESVNLGIEALNRIQNADNLPFGRLLEPLPSETEGD